MIEPLDKKLEILFLYQVLYRDYYERQLALQKRITSHPSLDVSPEMAKAGKYLFEAVASGVLYDVVKSIVKTILKKEYDEDLVRRLYQNIEYVIKGKPPKKIIRDNISEEMMANSVSGNYRISKGKYSFNFEKARMERDRLAKTKLTKTDLKALSKRYRKTSSQSKKSKN